MAPSHTQLNSHVGSLLGILYTGVMQVLAEFVVCPLVMCTCVPVSTPSTPVVMTSSDPPTKNTWLNVASLPLGNKLILSLLVSMLKSFEVSVASHPLTAWKQALRCLQFVLH